MSRALAGKRVDINLFNADPFPLLSVHVGIKSTFLLESALLVGKNTLSATITARASSHEIIREGLPERSKIHGSSS